MISIYLDMDGVLADFDAGLKKLGLDIDPNLNQPTHLLDSERKLKKQEMQNKIAMTDFFFDLPAMSDAHELWNAVKIYNPVILTAAPRFGGDESSAAFKKAAEDKKKWIKNVFGHIDDDHFICTTSAKKANFIGHKTAQNQILVDDRPANCGLWVDAGGIAILHLTAQSSIEKLKQMFI